jgi:hypothetical protein
MKTIKKAQLGGLIKKGIKQAVKSNTKKVEIPAKLKASIKKSQSGPKKLKVVGASEAEQIAHGKKPFLQQKPYTNPNYEKKSFLEREVEKTKPKPKTDKYGFDLRPDRNGGTHKKMQTGGKVTVKNKTVSTPMKSKIVDSPMKPKPGKSIYAFQGKKGMLAKNGKSMTKCKYGCK